MATTSAEARIALDETSVRSYIDDGFLVVKGLLADGEIDELRADLVRLARGAYPCPGIEPAPGDASDENVLRDILAIHFPHTVSPVMLRYLRHPAIANVLSGIAGAHLPHWDGRVKGFQSMVFVKPPGFQGQAWHQDEVFIPTRDRSLVGAWVAIDDATVENGCLWVLPGSHRTGYLYPLREHNRPEEFDGAPESFGFDDSEEVAVGLEAGSVLFFNGYLLHRSKPNRSDGYRRTFVGHYLNAWSLLPWRQRREAGDLNVAELDCRRVVAVAGEDPYAWKGFENDADYVYIRHRDRPRIA